ncbi:MAG: hypothetical protein CMB82_03330 [Flammeovirgaceae bacterium]|nr:hypothetical protein [Flammeovirgaceae bacterium]|tara:strand:+ start:1419 stop:2252 length:834 start_codon:yes stop_codon:yes gene_type:complete
MTLFLLNAQAQINLPAASSAASVTTKVGLTEVSIVYFRPKMKGRKIFGSDKSALLEYGSMWRTGANSGTKITLSTQAKIGGVEVPAGTYLIITTPGESQFNFMLYGDPSIGSNFSKIEENKILVNIKVDNLKSSNMVETLTFQISDLSEDNTQANIHFQWADASWKVPIEVTFDEIVMAEIADKTKVDLSNYMAAASYYLETGKDLNQALSWAKLFLAVENNRKYYYLKRLAEIQAGLGMKKEAIKTTKEALEKSKVAGDNAYIKSNEAFMKELKSK